MRQRINLRDTLFIAMSNFYYEEKTAYLAALNAMQAGGHDLTPFLRFALKGVELQCQRLLKEIRQQVAKALFRNTVADLFGRLESPRKRVMSARQVQVLYLLLEEEELPLDELRRRTSHFYKVKNPTKAFIRDLLYLLELQAVSEERSESKGFSFKINLAWPTQITETEFFRRMKELRKGKTYGFLSS